MIWQIPLAWEISEKVKKFDSMALTGNKMEEIEVFFKFHSITSNLSNAV